MQRYANVTLPGKTVQPTEYLQACRSGCVPQDLPESKSLGASAFADPACHIKFLSNAPMELSEPS